MIYNQIFNRLIIVYLVFIISFLSGKTKPIEGEIINEARVKLGNVNIISTPSGTGTQSNEKGIFSLSIPVEDRQLIFNHVGHIPDTLNVILFKNGTVVMLKEKVIEMVPLDVMGSSRLEFSPFNDKNSVIYLDSDELSFRGSTDIGDALFSKQAIHLNENMNGQKTASIRASSSEEMVFLYDGIRINTMGDPLFDLSMFSTIGLSGLELVMGSHEKALASSGTVNFIPKLSYGNSASFSQHFGTYNYGGYDGFGSVGFKYATLNSGLGKGQFSQVYSDTSAPEIYTNHDRLFMNIGIRNSNNLELRFMVMDHKKKFKNERTGDSVRVELQNLIAKMIHSHPKNESISLFAIAQMYEGWDVTQIVSNEKNDSNKGLGFEFEKEIEHAVIRLSSESSMSVADWKINESPVYLERQSSNFTGSLELSRPGSEKKIQLKDVKIILNKNTISDIPDTSLGIYMPHNNWRSTNSLFTASLLNRRQDKNILIYLNMGNVFRVPALSETISNYTQSVINLSNDLVPENKSTYELGMKVENDLDGNSRNYSLTISGFRYHYTDKIKQFQISGTPVQIPYNIGEAVISGFDSRLVLKPNSKWLSYSSSLSFYYFSDPMAFQLQPERMMRNIISINNKWFDLDLVHRSESARQITTIKSSGAIKPNYLEAISNYDVNLSSDLKYKWINTVISLSAKNINDSSQELDGVSIYDRRYSLNVKVSIN